MTTILQIPGRVPSNNGKDGLLRMHYRQKAELKGIWTMLFRSQARGKKHEGPVLITITRYCVKALEDFDNLVSTMKIPMDAVKAAGIIVDDKMRVIGQPEFRQVLVGNKLQEKYVIEITDKTT